MKKVSLEVFEGIENIDDENNVSTGNVELATIQTEAPIAAEIDLRNNNAQFNECNGDAKYLTRITNIATFEQTDFLPIDIFICEYEQKTLQLGQDQEVSRHVYT